MEGLALVGGGGSRRSRNSSHVLQENERMEKGAHISTIYHGEFKSSIAFLLYN